MAIPPNTRTYLPRLLTVLLLTCRYISRYRDVILRYLPPSSEGALDAVVDACTILSAIVEDQLE